MSVTSQACGCSKQHTGRTFFIRAMLNKVLEKHFPLSKDADFEYKAEFDDVAEILTIRKDV